MKVYRRHSAAETAAKGEPILTIRQGDETLYIVGVQRETEVALYGRPVKRGFSPSPSRQTEAQVILGHFVRLGNANGAAASQFNHEATAFDQQGLAQRFISDSDFADYDATRLADKEGWQRGDLVRLKQGDGLRTAPIDRFLGDDGTIRVRLYGRPLLENQHQSIYKLEDLEKVGKETA